MRSVKIVARNRRSRFSVVNDRSAMDQYHMRWLSRQRSFWQETYLGILTTKESVMELRIRIKNKKTVNKGLGFNRQKTTNNS